MRNNHAFVRNHVPKQERKQQKQQQHNQWLHMVSVPDESYSEDWRLFKARLVQQEQKLQKSAASYPTLHDNRWLYEQTVLDEGCLLVHCPQAQDAGQVLRDHHLFQAVILITEQTPELTKGIVLNLPTDMTLESQNVVLDIHYGGDSKSLREDGYGEEAEFQCLHNLRGLRNNSTQIMSGLYSCSIQDAAGCIEAGFANPTDFFVVAGHVCWPTVDALVEMHHHHRWRAVSIDADTLLELTKKQQDDDDDRESNTMWKLVLSKIGWVETNSHQYQLPSFLIQLASIVKQEWTRRLLFSSGNKQTRSAIKRTITIEPGDVIRALPHHDFVFGQQELHQSLLLILQDDKDLTVGVLLHHPTSEIDSVLPLPIRYGGWFHQLDENTEMPAFAVHRLKELEGIVYSEAIGKGFYKTSLEQVVEAVGRGVARLQDFLLLRGMCVWEKYESSPTFQDLYKKRRFEHVTEPTKLDMMWDILSKQEAFSSHSAEKNLQYSQQAWELTESSQDKNCRKDDENNDQQRLLRLGEQVLRIWMLTKLVQDDSG